MSLLPGRWASPASKVLRRQDILAKSGSALNCLGPEPFISIPYARSRAAIKDWSVKRWKTPWIERKDCLRTKETVEWAFAPINSTTFEAQKITP